MRRNMSFLRNRFWREKGIDTKTLQWLVCGLVYCIFTRVLNYRPIKVKCLIHCACSVSKMLFTKATI